jgi:hypothetical protein
VSIGNSFETLNLNLDNVTEVDIFRLHRNVPGVGLPGYWGLDNVSSSAFGAVPEPASWTVMLAGFAGIGAIVRRRRQVRAAALS